jgi:DNA polymerase
MRDSFHDLETFCRTPIKDGTHRYAEGAEVMLWAYALEDGPVKVWDLVNGSEHWEDELSGMWVDAPTDSTPDSLVKLLMWPDTLVWFQNGGHFDFVVLDKQLPHLSPPMHRRRDTMVQAFAHALPGSLEKMGSVLDITEDKRKLADGKRLVRLFCMPQSEDFQKKWGTDRATKQTHPAEWQKFIEYAAGDIVTMREARRKMPQWNYRGKQVELWHLDCKINSRGFAVDIELAEAAVRAEAKAKSELARRTHKLTDGDVESTTQRDELLRHILEIHGVDLPNMQADTLERRMADPDLPETVKELLGIRLQASMNSVSKYKALLKGVSKDGRLRGCMQFRGAGRTGRWAHRLFQPGNLFRPNMPQAAIEAAIVAMKADALELVFENQMNAMANTIRGAIIAPPGRKLVVSDLANIEGRVAAWLAGEEWKLQAFRDYDTFLLDENGNKIPDPKKEGTFLRKGIDLYVKAYMASFNIDDPALVGKDERQIGKVEELMFQYGGGVGAWITGAATYGIDLNKMTEQVYPVLPEWAIEEAADFMRWLYGDAKAKYEKALAEGFDSEGKEAALFEKRKAKVRHGLSEKTFIACDAIKRLWRTAHPAISSYWADIENTVRMAIHTPGVTYPCRKVKIRRDGAWLRVGLPSGRVLCYPNPKVEADGSITYTGQNTYTRQWCRVHTYGGKFLENFTQAVACDQLAEPMPAVEDAGYEIVLHVHDELATETPDEDRFNADELARLLCRDLGWNAGLPLAAAGFETYRYRKE